VSTEPGKIQGTATVIVPSCGRWARFTHLRRGREHAVLAHQPQHALSLARRADPLAAQPRPDLAVALADERRRLDHVMDRRAQRLVGHRANGAALAQDSSGLLRGAASAALLTRRRPRHASYPAHPGDRRIEPFCDGQRLGD
jgi:hypothetical protein